MQWLHPVHLLCTIGIICVQKSSQLNLRDMFSSWSSLHDHKECHDFEIKISWNKDLNKGLMHARDGRVVADWCVYMLLYAHICDYIRIYAVICAYSAYKYLPKMGQPDFVFNFENFENHNFGVENENENKYFYRCMAISCAYTSALQIFVKTDLAQSRNSITCFPDASFHSNILSKGFQWNPLPSNYLTLINTGKDEGIFVRSLTKWTSEKILLLLLLLLLLHNLF